MINLIKKELDKNEIKDISYLTFTKKAANDSKLRISDAMRINLKDMKYFGTIHSACYNLLNCDKNKIVGRSSVDFVNFCKKFNYSYSRYFFNEEELVGDITNLTEKGNILLDMYNRARILYPTKDNKFEYFYKKYSDEYLEFIELWQLDKFITQWVGYKDKNDLTDFVDMLELVLRDQLVYKPKIQFYDEQQDISPLLYEVYKHFTKFADKVYIAGDPNQSIYGFVGTKPSLFLKEDFDKSIILPKSHRLSKKVWNYSKEFILKSKKSYYNLDKVSPCDSEGRICRKDFFKKDLLNGFKGTTFILCRIWQYLSKYRDDLIYEGIPFIMGKGNIWNDKLVNINNGITKLRNDKIRLTYAEAHSIITSVSENLLSIKIKDYFKKKNSDRKFTADEFYSFFKNKNPEHILYNLDNNLKLSDLKKMALKIFLNKNKTIKDINLYLGTIHSVKGLEADNVILDNTISLKIDDKLYIQKHLDEEIRVFYVGMTRARYNLILLDNPYVSGESFPLLAKVF